MRKYNTIFLILLFLVLLTFPFGAVKATDEFKNTTIIIRPINEKFYKSHQPQITLHRPHQFHNYCSNRIKVEIIIFKGIVNLIKFISKYALGIVFFIWLIISLIRAIHNNRTKRKYKRDNNKYEAKRNEDEGDEKDRHSIYLVSKEKNSKDKFVYHHIINLYSLAKLDYIRPSRKNDCFPAKNEDYIMGEDIILYNITFDFRNIDK